MLFHRRGFCGFGSAHVTHVCLDSTPIIVLIYQLCNDVSDQIAPNSVADLEGVSLNPPLAPNYFNFMGKFMKNQVKC